MMLSFSLLVLNIAGKSQYSLPGNNIYPINTISWMRPDSNIAPFFDSALDNKNILMLSEADHGDGSTIEAQCAIMKALIDAGKVNTIYTESSWMVLDKINELIQQNGFKDSNAIKLQMRSSELRYWVDNGFWNYLMSKIIDGKIKLYGLGIDASIKIMKPLFEEAQLFSDVKEYLQLLKGKNKTDYEEIMGTYNTAYDGYGVQSNYYERNYNLQKGLIDRIQNVYRQQGNEHRMEQWQTVLNFFYWMYKRTLVLQGNKYVNVIEGDIQFSSFMSLKDSFMATHFLKHYQPQQGKKTIVLVSNYHALRNSQIIDSMQQCCKLPGVYLTGEMIDKNLPGQVYNLGFINAYGVHEVNYFERRHPMKYPRPQPNSLEYYLAKNYKGNYCMINLEKSPLKDTSFYMRPVYYLYLRSKWAKNYSGVFFIREMQPLMFKHYQLLPISGG